MKPLIILTTAFYFIIAPAPDAYDIAEISANFIVPEIAMVRV